MDWRSIKFDWNHARAFLMTAEEGSLAAAARALGLTQPTLGRQVTALEQEIGITLFKRSGRGLELTPNGLSLLEHVRAMADGANQFSLSATGKSVAIEGSICITTSEIFAFYVLPPIIQKLRRLEPGIEIEIIASNDESNLNRREADIAIRSFRPHQGELIAKKILDVKAYLYASTIYLQELGYPKTVAEFNNANFIDFEKSGQFLPILNALGFNLKPSNFPVTTKNNLVLWELVKQGVAIGAMSEGIGEHEPLVERAIPSLAPLNGEIWLVTHEELRTNRRVRLVFDFLASEISGLNL